MDAKRRKFITEAAFAAAGIALGVGPAKAAAAKVASAAKVADSRDICIFSKMLHWLDCGEMAAAAAEIGFDGIDLTVRPGGHVAPERVAADLPKAVAAALKAGLKVPLITTGITDARHPHTEPILKAAHQAGVKYYRTGWLDYQEDVPLPETLEKYSRQLTELARLNQQYNLQGAYQNHAGTHVGAGVWDLWYIIKDLDPRWMGLQYDIKHATQEGGSSWPLDVKLMYPYIKTIDIKDFIWEKKDGQWQIQNVPLGEGMVDFRKFFALVKQYNISGPISLHLEYPLGGAESGARKLSVNPDTVTAAMQKDLKTLRGYLQEAGL
ncbi:sugar phosphate isomerase/epimerase family protein [Pontibacter russatus]|uniref:sugar phosphate isomerase/epimerase family protein n=1 Tax=Pontibacter russatus TaxID=2694929 RepID=UPI001379FBF9|nr:sugar phosphate isomerase/epimerase family protein [Pontibacter russatus]